MQSMWKNNGISSSFHVITVLSFLQWTCPWKALGHGLGLEPVSSSDQSSGGVEFRKPVSDINSKVVANSAWPHPPPPITAGQPHVIIRLSACALRSFSLLLNGFVITTGLHCVLMVCWEKTACFVKLVAWSRSSVRGLECSEPGLARLDPLPWQVTGLGLMSRQLRHINCGHNWTGRCLWAKQGDLFIIWGVLLQALCENDGNTFSKWLSWKEVVAIMPVCQWHCIIYENSFYWML